MNSFLVIGFVCLAAMASVEAGGPLDEIHWHLYKKTFGKVYANASEESLRKGLFQETKRRVEEHNLRMAHKLGFQMGYSHLSDWTEDELSQLNGLKYEAGHLETLIGKQQQEDLPEFMRKIMEVDVKDLPKEVDWRKVAGRVSSVKDQGRCGSCWAFSTTGVLEGQQQVNASANGKLIPLSEQNLIDCSKKNLGCNGGSMYYALNDVAREGGIDTEQDYPYLEVNGPVKHSCSYNPSKSLMNQVSGVRVLDASEETLHKFVALFGPVSAGIDATNYLVNYRSGVLDDPECEANQLNHGILVVGYGSDADQGDYWIVKNSWGSAWGDKGYFKLSRNNGNMCGIASMLMIPTFK